MKSPSAGLWRPDFEFVEISKSRQQTLCRAAPARDGRFSAVPQAQGSV
jgi:hypothetical protein